MNTAIIRPTKEQFETLMRDVAPAAHAVILAQAFAETTRARVDAYIAPIFASYTFYPDRKWADEFGAKPGGIDHFETRIADMKHLYLTDLKDPYYLAFHADCDAAHRAHGFKGEAGHCPALEAEHLHVVAEHALIELTAPTFGIKPGSLYGDIREQFLKLVIGACINMAPDVFKKGLR